MKHFWKNVGATLGACFPQTAGRSSGHEGRLFDIWQLGAETRHQSEREIRELTQTAYLGETTCLCRVLGRYKMFVDTRDVGLSSHLMLDGFWEMWVTEAMIQHLRPGMTAIDIGANLGYFTLLMAEIVGPSGKVHAFEPNGGIARRLRDTLAINGYGDRATVHETALGDVNGEAALVIPSTEPKNAYIIEEQGLPGTVVVPVHRLDHFPELLNADFLKIDVEGSEERLWQGMTGLLDRNRPLTIFLEFTTDRYADAGAFIDSFLERGFALKLIDPKRGVTNITKDEILSANRQQDQMLVLVR